MGGEGKTRRKFDRSISITLLLRRLGNGVEVAIFYLRTNRNVTAEEVARLSDVELAEWGARKGLTLLDVPGRWWFFCRFIPHLDWGRLRAQRPPH